MTPSDIIAANRASALEQAAQDERNAEAQADMKADRLVNGHPPRTSQYFKDNEQGQELIEVERGNVESLKNNNNE
jgi:hypothetical protein